ncbi:hypothetical protein DK292_16220, partial [Listeria monocytogenes]|uniref:hypothetical protein n=1 Tax=Listeria monocytogenes TaxID=1639 RepID=UPI000D9DD885
GYTIDNVQWVHKKINIIKWHLSQKEFLYWCNLAANKNPKPIVSEQEEKDFDIIHNANTKRKKNESK